MGLLDRFKQSLGTPGQAPADPGQAKQIAAAVLLLEMVHADHAYHDVEYVEARQQLQAYFGLTEDEASELVAAAQPQADEAVSLYRFLKTLNDGLGMSDKREVLEMLWRVAYADRHLDAHEEHLLREVADLLYLPHREFIKAKLAVTGE